MNSTPEQRAEWARLAEAATPGPWYLRTNRHTNTDGTPWGWLDTNQAGNQAPPMGVNIAWSKGQRSDNNAQFIAAAREAIPALLADLEEVEADLEEWRFTNRVDELCRRVDRAEAELTATKQQLAEAQALNRSAKNLIEAGIIMGPTGFDSPPEPATQWDCEACLLAGELHRADTTALQSAIAEAVAPYKAKLAAIESKPPALQTFAELDGAEEPDPIERLRFFCSLAMRGQDWLDVEGFFDDVIAAKEAEHGK